MTIGGPVIAESGILIVDKPAGLTSHDVVARVRKARGIRRVGHAGTLDPDATGVLVVGVGGATRLLGYLAGSDKEYRARIVLGASTVTDDASGEVTDEVDASGLGAERIAAEAAVLTGDILQRPSAVSAVRQGGRRAYDRVRAGEQVDLAPRPVHVEAFDILALASGGPGRLALEVRVVCSSGTFVRALARDLGAALGVGGHVGELRRTRSGDFTEGEAIDLEAVAASALLPAGVAARRSLPHRELPPGIAGQVRQGVRVTWPGPPSTSDEVVALLEGADLVALARDDAGLARYAAVFPGGEARG